MSMLPVDGKSCYFTLNSTSLLLRSKTQSSDSSYYGISLSCSDLQEKLRHLREAGFTVQEGDFSGLHYGIFHDPDGVRYLLL